MRWIAVLLGAALAATYVSPAVGGPDLAGQLRRVDAREKRHYDALDRRLKATVLLALAQPAGTTVMSRMNQSGRFFDGTAYCPPGKTLTGGGTDWGGATLAPDFHVAQSSPTGGGWRAIIYAGGTLQPLDGYPTVYAICVS